MAATRVISIVGQRNAGKTTLLQAIAAEFARRRDAYYQVVVARDIRSKLHDQLFWD